MFCTKMALRFQVQNKRMRVETCAIAYAKDALNIVNKQFSK
jgi:hypothetical protein